MGCRRSAARRRAVLFIIAPLLWAAIAFADTIHVPGDYPTIQAAIDAAKDGDEILVAQGEYFENIDLLGKSITLRSEAGPKETIIDGQKQAPVIVCVSGEGQETIIDGFTLRNSWHSTDSAAGILIVDSSPTIIGCRFIPADSPGTFIYSGWGIRNQGGSPAIIDCTFEMVGFWCCYHCGGIIIQNASAHISGCAFYDMTNDGGGAAIRIHESDVVVTGSTFARNISHTSVDNIAVFGGSLDISNSAFLECFGGGGMALAVGSNFNWASSTTITVHQCHFEDNNSWKADIVRNAQVITDSTFVNNALGYHTSAVAISGGLIDGCTFIGNVGNTGAAAVRVGSGPTKTTILNSVFIENSVTDAHDESPSAGAVLTSTGPVVHTEIGGSVFCGNAPSHITGNWTNLGGNTFSPHCPVGDINGDGAVDVFDLLTLLSAWGVCAEPNDCPADLNGDGEVNTFDLLVLLSNWG